MVLQTIEIRWEDMQLPVISRLLSFVQQKTEKESIQSFTVDGIRAEHFVKYAEVGHLAF